MGRPHGVSGSIHPSGNESGESIDTRSGRAAIVSLTSSSSVLKLLVVALAPSISAHPVARFALPVRSMPTTLGPVLSSGHFPSRVTTRSAGLLAGDVRFPCRLALGRIDT